ncbi:MAG: hypothetical protein OEZ22_09760 [Spirochaetia bacterium]|nr:hypothetical protein [Spirochaetia bacterium]
MKKTFNILIMLLFSTVNLEGKEELTYKEKEADYKQRVKQFEIDLIKRKNYFPDGTIINTSISTCSYIAEEQNGLSVPKGANIKMLNFYTEYIDKKRVKHWQVIYKNKIYCIPNDNIKPKEKIVVLEGHGRLGGEIWRRYILLQNGTYVQVLETLGPHGAGILAIHPALRGNYTRTENTITLCIKEEWSQKENYKKLIKNKECTVYKKYTGSTKGRMKVLEGTWVMDKLYGGLGLDEFIYE